MRALCVVRRRPFLISGECSAAAQDAALSCAVLSPLSAVSAPLRCLRYYLGGVVGRTAAASLYALLLSCIENRRELGAETRWHLG